jgi:hypothetical protein
MATMMWASAIQSLVFANREVRCEMLETITLWRPTG